MTEQASFVTTQRPEASVVEVRGEIDILNAGDLRCALQDAASSGSALLVVSLTDVSYFDSQSLEIIVEFSKRMTLNRRSLLLVASPESSPRRLLDVSGISSVIPVFATIDEASAGTPVSKT